MEKLIINIFTNELVWMGQVDNVKTLVHRTSWHEIPNSELKVSKTAQGIEELQTGRILIVNGQKDKALIIEDLSASLDDEDITFTCIPLKGMLNYRICHPTDANNFIQMKQADIMMKIPDGNLFTQTRDPDRKFWNNDRTINMFRIAGLKGYGNTLDFTVDWDTGYIGDTIVSLAKNSTLPLGWNVYITDDFKFFEMDVYEGQQKHINQIVIPPVVFSEEFGNIKNVSYEYSIKEWRNVIYMIWSSEGSDIKNATPVGNTAHGATVSFNRKELIYNSNKKVSGEVVSDGRSELNKRPHIENFNAEIVTTDNTMTTYKANWDVGDIVTVQSKEVLENKLVSIDVQITEIEETYDSGEYSINATFGAGRLTLIDLIKQHIEQRT